MNYLKHYNNLIDKATCRDYYSKKWNKGTNVTELCTEVHHILPKCLGGTNDKANLVVLTLKEHFIAHYLLCKIHPTNEKINNAFIIMINRSPDKNANSYAKYRELFIIANKKRMNHPDYWNKERKEKARLNGLKLAQNPEYLKRVSEGVKKAYLTTNLKEKISQASKSAWSREEYRENQIKIMKDRCSTPEYRKQFGERIKKQNADNPQLKQKRIDAISNHMYNKSPEWIKEQTEVIKTRMNTPEYKEKYRNRYHGSNFDRSRKVIDTLTKIIYPSAVAAAKARNLNLSTVKKYLYKDSGYHNLRWFDNYQGDNDE